MTEEIKPIDTEHIAIIETLVHEQLISKVTLEAQRVALLEQVADIDDKLTYFMETPK